SGLLIVGPWFQRRAAWLALAPQSTEGTCAKQVRVHAVDNSALFRGPTSLRWHDVRLWLEYKGTSSPQRRLGSNGRVGLAVQPAAYMLCKHRHGALYTGVTSARARRVWEHYTGAVAGFTKRYGLKVLVWYEPHGTMQAAITREKHIKAWQRD